MSNYVVPSAQINQELQQLPVFTSSPQAVLVIGQYMPINCVASIAPDATALTGLETITYALTPTVKITSTTGTGATAIPVLTAGKVTAFTITNPGTGYLTAPTVTVTPVAGDLTGVVNAASIATITATRAVNNTYAGTIGSVTSTADIIAAFGDISVANPIAMGLNMAVLNANGTAVYYATVNADTASVTGDYSTALTLADKSNLYYGIVPLSYNLGVQAAVMADVNAMSTAANAKWRTCWLSTAWGSGMTTGAAYIATLPAVGVEGTTGSTGPRRVHNVFPDQFYLDTTGTTALAGYFMAAACAGARAGSVPHQSLTNTEIVGPVYIPRVLTMSETDLNVIAGAGVWIVTQDSKGSTAYTRHQLTADSTNLNYREDSVTADVDSITYGLQAALAPFIGIYNINPATVLKIRAAVDGELSYRLNNTYTERAGNQLTGYKIINISQDPNFQDTINVSVGLNVPYPVNYIVVTLSI